MSPTQARAFHAVAKVGSFIGAAKALNVSQPTITTQVKELEKHYGVELFHRHPRGVTLTDTGRELFEITRRLYVNQQDAIEYLQAARDLRTGHIRVGSYGPSGVIELLSELTTHYPDLSFSLNFANSQALQDGLLSHDLDVAVFTPIEKSAEFHFLPFYQSRQVVIVSKQHPWSQRKRIRISELRDQRLIVREKGSEARRAAEQALGRAGHALDDVIEIGSREGIVAAVARNIGIGMIFDEGLIPEESVTKHKIHGTDIVANVNVVCLAERKNNRIIRVFLNIAEEHRTISP